MSWPHIYVQTMSLKNKSIFKTHQILHYNWNNILCLNSKVLPYDMYHKSKNACIIFFLSLLEIQ